MTPPPFWKMAGAGNDFIVIDVRHDGAVDLAALARELCPRSEVGADGLIAVLSVVADTVQIGFHNADGSQAAFCGNGARCAALFAVRAGLTASPLTLRFPGHQVRAFVREEWVELHGPRPEPRGEPLTIQASGGAVLQAREIVAGVPHLIIDETPARLDLARFAAEHPELLRRANVTALTREGVDRLRVRTFERGVGATLACGSGALAAACFVEAPPGGGGRFTVVPPGGEELIVTLAAAGSLSVLAGSARVIYRGVLER